jgi:hypothetical protein
MPLKRSSTVAFSTRKRDPRIPPLRKIVSSYAEPADSYRTYDVLECGHTAARDEFSGDKRRRCARCKHEALQGKT